MIAFVGLCILLGAGHLLRMRIRLLQRLYLPSCVVAGLLGLIIIQGLGALEKHTSADWLSTVNNTIAGCSIAWAKLPSFLINIVFACLFLGVTLPKLSTLWRRAGPQVAYGQVVAWGQYVVAIGLWLVLLGWLFPSLPGMFAGVLPVGFEGGHGTAAGMAQTFERLGWAEGKDFALASATCGILGAIIVGMILVNWAVRRGYTVASLTSVEVARNDSAGVIPIERRPSAGKLTISSDVLETFSLHIVIVGIAVLLGWLMKSGLVGIEQSIPALAKYKLLSSFPLFPLCMLGGLIVQLCEERFDRARLIDLGLTRRIQNTALDFLVVAAIATIRLNVVLHGLVPLLLLVVAGVGWNVFCLMVLARRMLPDAWFERAIAEMGQSMGVTATGLLLLRVVDPDYESPAANAFACKQLIHEPFMGGGLWTGMAIPLIAVWGAVPVFFIAAGAVSVWLLIVFGVRIFRRTHSGI